MNGTIECRQTKPNNTGVFAFIIFLTFSCNTGFSQNNALENKLTFSKTGSVYEVLKALEKEINLYFSYDADLFDVSKQISVQVKDEPLQVLLDHIFTGENLYYKVIGNQIALYKGQFEKLLFPSDTGQASNIFRIEGQVFEYVSNHPVPYATVVIKGRNRGVVANNEGTFTLALADSNLNDTLVFSCMGFKSIYIPIKSFENGTKKIYLSEDYISIQEVIIRHINPVSVISQAIENRDLNYSKEPYNFIGFYRETIQKRDEYIAVTEVVMEGYKTSYQSPFTEDQVKMVKGRKIIDKQNLDTVLIKMQAGLKNILQLDVVKYLPDFLDEKRNELYRFDFKDITSIEGEDAYVIGFTPKDLSDEALFKGNIYIGEKTRAVHHAEFQLQKANLDFATSMLVLKKPRGFKVKLGGVKYTVQYAKLGNVYYIHYLKSEMELKVHKKNELFNTSYLLTMEMVITATHTDNVTKIPLKETIKSTDIVKDQIGPYDELFWGKYDYIPPEKPLLDAIQEFTNE